MATNPVRMSFMSDDEYVRYVADRALVDANYVRAALNKFGRKFDKIIEYVTSYRG